MALVGTPAGWLVDFMASRIHRADKSAPPSSRAPSPGVERQWAPNPSEPQREPITFPLPQGWWPWRRMSWHHRWCLYPQVPQGHSWSLRKLYTSNGTIEETPGPLLHPSTCTSCQVFQVYQLEGLWQNVHVQRVWQNLFTLGQYDVSLPSGAHEGIFSLSLVWDELFRSLKVLLSW